MDHYNWWPQPRTAEFGVLLPKESSRFWLLQAAAPLLDSLRRQGRISRWHFILADKNGDAREFFRLRLFLRPCSTEGGVLEEIRRSLRADISRRRGAWLEARPFGSEEIAGKRQRALTRHGGARGLRIAQLFMALDSRLTVEILKRHPVDWGDKMADGLLSTYAFYAAQLLPDPRERVSGVELLFNKVAAKDAETYFQSARQELDRNAFLSAALENSFSHGLPADDELAGLLKPRRAAVGKIGKLLRSGEPGDCEGFDPRPLVVFSALLHYHFARWELNLAKEMFFNALIREFSLRQMARSAHG